VAWSRSRVQEGDKGTYALEIEEPAPQVEGLGLGQQVKGQDQVKLEHVARFKVLDPLEKGEKLIILLHDWNVLDGLDTHVKAPFRVSRQN
jgi:hypothetical protein